MSPNVTLEFTTSGIVTLIVGRFGSMIFLSGEQCAATPKRRTPTFTMHQYTSIENVGAHWCINLDLLVELGA
jgi:hypothetical protein